MSFLPFVRRWFGAQTTAIQAQSTKPDPDLELVDRAEVLLEDLNDFQGNVAASFDSLPGAFLTAGGNRTDGNIDVLTGGGDADALHTHPSIPPILSNTPPPPVAATSSAGSSGSVSRADHTHASPPVPALATAAPPAIAASSAVGTSTDAARADHTHSSPPIPELATVAPPAVAASSVVGTALRVAREDHTHASPPAVALTSSPPPAVAASSSVGTATEAARADHTHASPPIPGLATAAPPAVAPSSSIGTSTRAAREDHTHASPPAPGAMLMWGNTGWGTGTNTKYADPYWTSSLAGTVPVQIRAPRAGTLRNLMVLTRVAGAGSFTARVRINDVDSILAVSVGVGVLQGENITDVVAVAKGDRIDVEIVRPLAGSPSDITITAELA